MDHPCKETCSGWKQGFEKGYACAQEEAEPLISDIHKKDLEYLTNKIAAEKAKNAELENDLSATVIARNASAEREKRFKEVIEDILSNVSLDWYVQQFAKPITPSESGVIAAIHSRGTLNRIKKCFSDAREALKENK